MFQKLYDKALRWSRHKRAVYYLSFVSFTDSSFFPITPLVMMVPMVLARPESALRYALITTFMSGVGAIAGYGIGYYLFESISPFLQTTHYWDFYLEAKDSVDKWGIWAILIGGFMPVPYKIFTITAGSLNMAILPFILASSFGRGTRFCILALLLKAGGAKFEAKLREYIDLIVWLGLGLVAAFLGASHFL